MVVLDIPAVKDKRFAVLQPKSARRLRTVDPPVSILRQPAPSIQALFPPLTCSAGYTICKINSFYCCPGTRSCVAAGNSVLCSDTAAGGGSDIPITTVMAVSQGLGAPVGVGSPSGGTSGVGGNVPAGAPGQIEVLSTTVTPPSSGSEALKSWGSSTVVMLATVLLIVLY